MPAPPGSPYVVVFVADPRANTYVSNAISVLVRELAHRGQPVPGWLRNVRVVRPEEAPTVLQRTFVDRLDAAADADLAVTVSYQRAARRLGVAERTIRRMVSDGRLPARRLGRRVVIPVAELDKIADDTGEHVRPEQRMAQGYENGPDGKARRRLAAVEAVRNATSGLEPHEVAALHAEIAGLQQPDSGDDAA